MKMISEAVRDLVQYGLDTGLLDEEDRYYARNQILSLLGLTEYEEPEEPEKKRSLEDILKTLLDYAAENGLLEHDSVTYRDLFDTKLITPATYHSRTYDRSRRLPYLLETLTRYGGVTEVGGRSDNLYACCYYHLD